MQRQPGATPFHHPAWAQTVAECYRFRPFAVLLESPGGGVGLPVIEVRHSPGRAKWVSLPFTDHCPPLGAPSMTQPALVTALDALRSASGVRRLEVRSALKGRSAHPGARSHSHLLDLTSDEHAVFATFHRSQVQRNIRRAQRDGVTVRRSTAETDLTGVFYRLHTRTRQRLGVPVQPLRYFRVLWRRMIESGLGFVAMALLDGRPVAAAVFLQFNGTLVYKYGASDPDSWHARPNHLLFWEVIRWACKRGFHTLDFGRTDAADESLRRFKSQWGTVEVPLTYTVISDDVPPRSHDTLPPLAAEFIRRTPAFVARGVGAAAYRFSA